LGRLFHRIGPIELMLLYRREVEHLIGSRLFLFLV